MVCRTIEKTSTLLLAVACVAVSMAYTPEWEAVGLSHTCGWAQRFVFSFFHASLFHAVLNMWCLLSVVFLYPVSWLHMLIAYAIAVVTPACFAGTVPTVGFSVVYFALLGIVSFMMERKLYFHSCMGICLLTGFFIPQVNGLVHLYGYIAGIFVGFLMANRNGKGN